MWRDVTGECGQIGEEGVVWTRRDGTLEGWDRWVWRDWTGGCGGCGGMEKVAVEGWDRRMCTWSEWWDRWMWRNRTGGYVRGQADVGVTWRNGTEDADGWGKWMWRNGTG